MGARLFVIAYSIAKEWMKRLPNLDLKKGNTMEYKKTAIKLAFSIKLETDFDLSVDLNKLFFAPIA